MVVPLDGSEVKSEGSGSEKKIGQKIDKIAMNAYKEPPRIPSLSLILSKLCLFDAFTFSKVRFHA